MGLELYFLGDAKFFFFFALIDLINYKNTHSCTYPQIKPLSYEAIRIWFPKISNDGGQFLLLEDIIKQ